MRRVLQIMALFIGVVLLGAAIFVATFDVDRYRPMVINQLQGILGRPVRLDRLSLGWHGGITGELHGLSILPVEPQSQEAALTVETIRVALRVLPLFRKQLQLASVALIKPTVQLRRRADGVFQLGDLALQPGQGAVESVSSGGAAAVPLLISSLSVQDGAIRLRDEQASPPAEWSLNKLQISVRNFSLQHPNEVSLRAALFSDSPNLTLTGRVRFPHDGRPASLEAIRLTADLNHLDLPQLLKAFPALQTLKLQAPLGGQLRATVEQFIMNPEGLNTLAATVRLERGRLQLATMGSPVEVAALEAVIRPGQIELTTLSATVAEGTVSGSGTWQYARPQANLTLTAERLNLKSLLPAVDPQEPQLQGFLTASLEGASQGPGELAVTFSGRGVVRLEDGKITNLNILQEVFRRLSILPGLAERLLDRLPESSKTALANPDTVLEPIDWPVTIDRGRLVFPTLRLATETFELVGPAAVGFDRSLSSQLILRITPDLSAAIVEGVTELQALLNAQGQLELPIAIHGQLPRVAVMPDVPYVASKLLATKTEELLGNLLQKALGTEEETAPQ